MIPLSTLYRRDGYKAPPWRIGSLLLIYFCLSTQLVAQVQRGQFHLGGQFSFENNFYEGGKSFSSTIQPEIGLMLSKKWSIGVSAPFNIQASTQNRPYYRLGVGPFVRRYFDLKSGFYAILHLQAETQFNLGRQTVRSTQWEVQATPSIGYFFSPRFALEAGFGGFTYVSNRSRSSVQDSKTSFNQFRIQSTPVVGLRYYFPHSSQE
ncbi:hypothetical protein [Haliscomenobacter sp.]|uniref:hypothetical protein n=1 Tax=Haliscomenobacter sp. TaxID=2717303 RepID=UPI003593333E